MKYNSNLEPAEMSYFRLNLLSFLRDSHPDKANDLSFIAGRGDMAAEAYSQAIKNDLDHIQAAEIANETLFKGLHFSPYWSSQKTLVKLVEACGFGLAVCGVIEKIFLCILNNC